MSPVCVSLNVLRALLTATSLYLPTASGHHRTSARGLNTTCHIYLFDQINSLSNSVYLKCLGSSSVRLLSFIPS